MPAAQARAPAQTIDPMDQTRDDLNFTDGSGLGLSAALGDLSIGLQENKFSSHNNSTSTATSGAAAASLSDTVVRADPNDSRPIRAAASGQYDLSNLDDDDEDYDFEFEDNFSEVEMATMDSGILNEVKQVYNDVLLSATAPFVAKNSLEIQEDNSK